MTDRVRWAVRRRAACLVACVLLLGMSLGGCRHHSLDCDCDCWPCGQFGPTNPCLCKDAVDACPPGCGENGATPRE